MKILITGGAGFIGSNLAKTLLKENNQVVIVDNFSDYYNPTFKKDNIKDIKNDLLELCTMDINNTVQLESLFDKYEFEKVIHLAACVGVRNSLLNPVQYVRTNIEGTVNLLNLLKENKYKDLIFASSSSVYGDSLYFPFSESAITDKPVSPYAASKKAAESMCYTYHKLYNVRITILRFFTVYGSHGRPDMAPYMITESLLKEKQFHLYGDGTASRDFTNIRDIVNGILLSLENPFSFEIFNLGNSSPIIMKDFILLLERITGKKSNILRKEKVSGDVSHTYADMKKAHELLGFCANTKLEEGLEEFVDWFKKNRL